MRSRIMVRKIKPKIHFQSYDLVNKTTQILNINIIDFEPTLSPISLSGHSGTL